MPSLDHLLNLSVEELKLLTDEQLREHYAPVFALEPIVPVNAYEEEPSEETTKVKKEKKPKKQGQMAELKQQLLKEDPSSW